MKKHAENVSWKRKRRPLDARKKSLWYGILK
jgi:hypothetical protein